MDMAGKEVIENLDDDFDEELDDEASLKAKEEAEELEQLEKLAASGLLQEVEDDLNLDHIENLLEVSDAELPKFTLAKNKARFLRMLSWYRQREEWIDVAPLSGVTKLFKQQVKELEGIRSAKMDYEMELEMGTLTPSQRSYRRDELRMCKVHEKLAVHLIGRLQLKIKSGRR
jgi:hypothetical protein